MTEYRNIYVNKRNFTVLVSLPELSDTAETIINADDVRIARNGDRRITRNGDVRVAHNTTTGRPRIINAKKRNFTVLVKKVNSG